MIDAFDYIAFIDDPEQSTVKLAITLGLIEQTQSSSTVRHFTSGDVLWVIHGARSPAEQQFLRQRGPAPYLIGLKDHYQPLKQHEQPLLLGLPLPTLSQQVRLAPDIALLASQANIERPQHPLAPYSAIDHCALACHQADVIPIAKQLIDTFNLHTNYKLDVNDGHSGMQSLALANQNGAVRLPIIYPAGASSQVQHFLDQAHGPGIQHIGLATDNIISTVRHLKTQGIKFLTVQPEYYTSEHFVKAPLSDTDKASCQDLNILIDYNDQGDYLLQLFTQPCLGAMMIELIERHNHQTFGANNIKALFQSVAAYQED